jgi:hypothetical protein
MKNNSIWYLKSTIAACNNRKMTKEIKEIDRDNNETKMRNQHPSLPESLSPCLRWLFVILSPNAISHIPSPNDIVKNKQI